MNVRVTKTLMVLAMVAAGVPLFVDGLPVNRVYVSVQIPANTTFVSILSAGTAAG